MHFIRGTLKFTVLVVERLAKILGKYATHILILGRWPPALEETNVAATCGNYNCHMCTLIGRLNGYGVQWLKWIIRCAQTKQRHTNVIQFIVQRGIRIIIIHMGIAKLLGRKQLVELLDGLALAIDKVEMS